jgi:hypothetical protein
MIASERVVSRFQKTAVEDKSWAYYDHSAPKTPWGRADSAYILDTGVIWYGTPSHGGLKVTSSVARKMLSHAALKMGESWGGAYWYEEDIAYTIPFYEVPAWNAALTRKAGGKTPSQHELEDTIKRYFPKYFELKETGYKLPTMPKPGEAWKFEEPLSFGRTMQFERGDLIKISQARSSGVVFSSNKFPNQLFRLRLQNIMDGAISPA